MRPPRNPFRLRAAEQIDGPWTFLSLLDPSLIEVLPEEGLWDRRVIVRSSAGGGKTTLLRLFTPESLRLLHSAGGDEALRDARSALTRRGALAPQGPQVAGALISLAGKYSPLEQLTSIDEGRRLHTFLALLNARVLLAGLRAHLELAGLRYPQHLDQITLQPPDGDVPTTSPELPASGLEIFNWARSLETGVATVLSSLGDPNEQALPADQELTCLEILGRGRIEVNGASVRARTVVLLDDVHRLSLAQRSFLVDTLLARRAPTPVWIAERYEALTPDELLSLGVREARDTFIIDIEQYWRGARRHSFQKLALGAADRRTLLAPEAQWSSFASMLQGPNEQSYAAILGDVERRLVEASQGRSEFAAWIESRLEPEANARDRAIALRALQIRIYRELAASQLSFDVFVRDEEALNELESKRAAADIRDAAELFLCRDYDLPYYFGPERLTLLASANIDQFLELAGDEFEALSSASLLGRRPTLGPGRQEQVLKGAVGKLWREIAIGVEGGARVQTLLDGIGDYAAEKTYQPTAPYAPGVTGVALRRSEADEVQRALCEEPGSWRAELGRLLAALIAHNLVSAQSSEAKSQRWAVYYVNRALCLRYGLPLAYGGWQPVTAERLYEWSRGDRVRSQQRLVA